MRAGHRCSVDDGLAKLVMGHEQTYVLHNHIHKYIHKYICKYICKYISKYICKYKYILKYIHKSISHILKVNGIALDTSENKYESVK